MITSLFDVILYDKVNTFSPFGVRYLKEVMFYSREEMKDNQIVNFGVSVPTPVSLGACLFTYVIGEAKFICDFGLSL